MIITITLFITFFTLFIPDALNMQLLSQVSFDVESSDITGFEQDGREFAVIGLTGNDCAAFFDITDPINPFEVGRISGEPSIWRDIKYWNNHVYIGSESAEGVKVVDVSNPDNPTLVKIIEDVLDSHNIHIYEGFLYVVGSDEYIVDEQHDIWIYDLNIPSDPQLVGTWDSPDITGTDYIHDLQVYNDKIYAMAIFSSTVYIIDVSDKTSPQTLTSWQYPGMAHDCAVSADERYLVTADEMEGGYIRIWDIQDYTNPIELDSFITNPNNSVHNVYIKGNKLFASWYADGTRVFDISNPQDIEEIAYYDMTDVEGLYVSNWGIYVYLPSGNIIASDIETGLYVLQLGGLTVQHQNIEDVDDETGPYAYFSASVSSLLAQIEDVNLNYSLDGINWNQAPMYNNGSDSNYSVTMTFDDYNILIRYYISASDDEGNYAYSSIEPLENPYLFIYGDLEYEVFHDFESNHGWNLIDNTASAGVWERAIPNGTIYQGVQVQPDQDNSIDGNYCYVTGNLVGDSVGFDDVDNGVTTIISPNFELSNYESLFLTYHKWFSNNLGDNPSTDKFTVEVSNDGGLNWKIVESTNLSNNNWKKQRFILDNIIDLTDEVRFKVSVEDIFYEGNTSTGGSLVEAAFDDFYLQIVSKLLNIGDVNSDNLLNVLDVVILVNFALNLSFPSNDQLVTGDINDDNEINVLDVVLLVNLVLD